MKADSVPGSQADGQASDAGAVSAAPMAPAADLTRPAAHQTKQDSAIGQSQVDAVVAKLLAVVQSSPPTPANPAKQPSQASQPPPPPAMAPLAGPPAPLAQPPLTRCNSASHPAEWKSFQRFCEGTTGAKELKLCGSVLLSHFSCGTAW